MTVQEPTGYVYFIQAGDHGPVKIGWAVDVERRLAAMQTGNPETLRVRHQWRCMRHVEGRFHRLLQAHRVRGEWFDCGVLAYDWFMMIAAIEGRAELKAVPNGAS